MESLIYVEMDCGDVMFTLRDSPLLPPDVFLSTGLDSVICGKIEKTTSITATFLIKTRTLDQIHTVKVPERQHVNGVPRNVAVVVKRLQAHFPPFSTQQRTRSPCTNTQGLSQCNCGTAREQADKQRHSMTLFLALANKQHRAALIVTSWPCWQLQLVWDLGELLKV